jgi:glycosyltransferase involved in cell wall biosynthesis
MPYDRWEQFWLPAQSKRDGVQLLHCPLNFGLPYFSHCPRVLTLHDAIDQRHAPSQSLQPKLTALRERLRYWIARTRAHRVITVSQHAQNDLVRYLGLPASKVVVIPEAADPRFHEVPLQATCESVLSRYDLNAPYFFYVGGWERRKNIPFLLRAFAQAQLNGMELVLAGGKDDQRDELLALARSLGMAHSLKLLGFVADIDLPALYAQAIAFVYPSEYEGFGLQLCEAMALGRPILCSNATSLPEVLGNGGATFPLDDASILADLMRRLATDAAYRADLADRSRKRSTDFSWDRTARETLDVYRQLGAG